MDDFIIAWKIFLLLNPLCSEREHIKNFEKDFGVGNYSDMWCQFLHSWLVWSQEFV